MNWDRIQRMQMEAQQMEARFRAEIDQLSEQVHQLREARIRLIEERDRARNIAVHLEQELAHLAWPSPVCAVCSGELVAVEVKGTVR